MVGICLTGLEEGLLAPTAEFCREIGLELCAEEGIPVQARAGDRLAVEETDGRVTVTWRTRNEWFRALTHLPAFLKDRQPVSETGKYGMLCYMADNSRNAVLNLPSAKRLIRRLAGMGYTSLMLYTEDTYELPEYPYFGYMRGRFSAGELRELDDYADSFGLELIPCIQTLAHLSSALRWPDFAGYQDTSDILLVGDARTYRFVEAALRQCAACFRSRRINIGMDEAHRIACGEYLRRNGYRRPSDVMLEHLCRVVEICHRVGFRPMMWVDMFFRMSFGGRYYVSEGSLPAEVVEKVPDGLDLIYWDYYTTDRNRFAHMLECHRQFRNPTIFAGGAWKWSGFGAHNAFSLKSANMQLDVCAEYGVDRVIVTSWGDNGGEASQFSSMASLLYYAERCYGVRTDSEWMNRRAWQCFGTSFDTLLAFDLPDRLPETDASVAGRPKNPSKYLLYNDLLERLMDCHLNRETAPGLYMEHASRLEELAGDPAFGYAFDTLSKLCRVVSLKCDMGWRLYQAYGAGDRTALAGIANREIPVLLTAAEEFLAAFRRQWYLENKTFGFVAHEIRLGGLMERIRSVGSRLNAYLNGEIDEIEELSLAPLPMSADSDGAYICYHNWHNIVAAGIL